MKYTLLAVAAIGCMAVASEAQLTAPAPPSSSNASASNDTPFDCSLGSRFAGVFYPSIDWYTKAIQSNPRDANAYYCRGSGKALLGRFGPAFSDLSVAVALTDDLKQPVRETLAWWVRGAILESMYANDAAIVDYTQALGLEPSNVELYVTRGAARLDNSDTAGALADYNQAVSLDPANTGAYRGRAAVKRAMGDNDGAAADTQKAESLKAKPRR